MRRTTFVVVLLGLLLCLLWAVPAFADTLDSNIDVTYPAGGETILQDSDITITWDDPEAQEGITWYELYYCTNGGSTWNGIDVSGVVIDDGVGGSLEWTTPDVSTDEAMVKVVRCHIEIVGWLPTLFREYNKSGEFTLWDFLIVQPFIPFVFAPAAPSDLDAELVGVGEVALSWTDNADNEDGFKVERKKGSGSFSQIDTVADDVTSYVDDGLLENTNYTYRVRAYNSNGDSAYCDEAGVSTTVEEEPEEEPEAEPEAEPETGGESTQICLYLDKYNYYVDGTMKQMDTMPVSQNGRTFLPIRYVAQPLGAGLDWDSSQQMATISLGGTTVQLWVGQNMASVNGSASMIDEANPSVAPFLQPPGRVMLPLRFISENLGCSVEWVPSTRGVVVTYPAS